MSGMWKRSHGRTSKAPPDERGGYRYVRPTATAPHLDSTLGRRSRMGLRKSPHPSAAIAHLLNVALPSSPEAALVQRVAASTLVRGPRNPPADQNGVHSAA